MTILVHNIVNKYPFVKPYAEKIMPGLAVVLVWYLWSNLHWTWMIPRDFLIALLKADLIVGLVHMITDYYRLSEKHHTIPASLINEDFYDRSGDHILFGFIYFWSMSALAPYSSSWINIVVFGAFLGAFSNEYHRYQHMASNAPWIIKLLWKTGLFLSPSGHHVHHTAALTGQPGQAYCILTGHTEPIVKWVESLLPQS